MMYKHLKVTVVQDFYIPAETYDEHYKETDKILRAIRNNINGWQWSGSKINYETQGEVSASPMTSGGTNTIYREDLR